MIQINFVVSDQKKKQKAQVFFSSLNIPLEIIAGTAGAVVIFLFLLHSLLFLINLTQFLQHKTLIKQLQKIQSQKESVDAVIGQLRALQGKVKSLGEITDNKKVLWAQKLNLLSDHLPRGVWLRKAAVNEEAFFVEGSAISKQNEEMLNIHAFTSELKGDPYFISELDDLELGSILRRRINQVEIADFLITAKIK